MTLGYASPRIEELARQVAAQSSRPLHRAFAQHLLNVAKATEDLERVLSGDRDEGSEDEAIRKVVSPAELADSATSHLKRAIKEANEALKELNRKRGGK